MPGASARGGPFRVVTATRRGETGCRTPLLHRPTRLGRSVRPRRQAQVGLDVAGQDGDVVLVAQPARPVQLLAGAQHGPGGVEGVHRRRARASVDGVRAGAGQPPQREAAHSRRPSTATAASASWNCTAWNAAQGLPELVRPLTCSTASSTARSRPPESARRKGQVESIARVQGLGPRSGPDRRKGRRRRVPAGCPASQWGGPCRDHPPTPPTSPFREQVAVIDPRTGRRWT